MFEEILAESSPNLVTGINPKMFVSVEFIIKHIWCHILERGGLTSVLEHPGGPRDKKGNASICGRSLSGTPSEVLAFQVGS